VCGQQAGLSSRIVFLLSGSIFKYDKKRAPFRGPLLSSNFYYLYTKIPLSVFKIKPETIKEVKILVEAIHFVCLSAYKNNGILNKTN
jgi:hypothetical protein